MPAANELSVWMGVAGCGWPISMRAVRSIEEEGSNFGFTGGGDDMLHEARDGVNGSVVARWIGIFVGWNFVAEEEVVTDTTFGLGFFGAIGTALVILIRPRN